MTPGTKLGPYEILAPIGAGGMGEVYRARDTKLKREVAVKVLPEAFALDPERMARFQREAEVLASLNHPNIAHIYGVEERALVMELVEGESPHGPLPFEEAWKIAAQIAEALDYAHEKGIVHRDLKPANVKVTPDGMVKLLDFGLAKAFSNPAAVSGSIENSPTLTLGATQLGVILGTAGYMAPEQAKGKAVDKRADIWSFGVVLYELLTGERLFHGEDVSDTLAQVLTKEPDLSRAPAQARKLLRRCLEKDPKKRLRDIGEVRYLLDEPAAATAPVIQERRPRLTGVAAAALAVIAAGLGWIAWRATRPDVRPLVRWSVDLGPEVSMPPLDNSPLSTVALSPDGLRLVYLAGNSSSARLFIRRLDQTKATELPGTEGADAPFFSPDSQWVGFANGTKLNKISVEGGAVVPLADVTVFGGATWGPDGNIVISEPLAKGLLQVPASGGTPHQLTELSEGESAHAFPQVLPGGKAVLFTAGSRSGSGANIDVVTLADHRRKTVYPGGSYGRYLPSGHLVYVSNGTLFAVPFDLDRLETRGTPVPVLDDVAYHTPTGGAQYDFSAGMGHGALVYRTGGPNSSVAVAAQWVDGSGKREALRVKPGIYSNPRLSPDGKRLAMAVTEGGNPDIWVYDLERDGAIRLTLGLGATGDPVWTPNGRYIIFGSIAAGLWWTRSDGAGQPQHLTQGKLPQLPQSFTSDGKQLSYFEISGRPQMWTVPIEDRGDRLQAGTPVQFLRTNSVDLFPTLSPDGRWLAYLSNLSGQFDAYVRPFRPPAGGQGGQWQISNTGTPPAQTPLVWLDASHELLYESGDQLMAVNYTVNGDSFKADNPRVRIPKLGGREWDVTPDGKRVLVLAPANQQGAPASSHEVVVLENFFDYLRQRVPVSK